ncbi:MAG TPA: SagB family peptide dehydrogenase [Bradyrhizobium sp.]|uniref:SagB/ThcOx family dehydrogenase n=1 Tax=Bradyrhizobium sp. TaxID=376 RepID=UPI002C34D807|nr:SagB family peptide dehydrogenase [Bradyrhizobium sp.]HLZ03629.1 SagB family peptide dehydrogenase [Bradyrhizobium sp.]
MLAARVNDHVTLDVYDSGKVGAFFDGYAIEIGTISTGAVKRARALREGLPIASLSPPRKATDQEIEALVRHLARSGLLEYCLVPPRGRELVAIEPQMQGYWPQAAKLRNSDTLVLSRFAYLRRRGSELVLESPRSPALFRIANPKLAAAIAALVTPQKVGTLLREKAFAGLALLGLLVECEILFKVGAKDEGLRASEGDEHLVVWDFHDLLFHTHSTEGRQANPLGGRYPYIDAIAPPAAVRPPWEGAPIDLAAHASAPDEPASSLAALLAERRSVRDFDEARPIRLAELARFLDQAARVKSKWSSQLDFGEGSIGPMLDYTSRPYPSAGSAYELELYLTVNHCEGLARGLYHYDADRHALVPIAVRTQELESQLSAASLGMDAMAPPQILLTIAARFNRVAWKYSAIAYSLILKDVGVLLQTLYLTATDLGLGGCAIGTGNIDLFARMTRQPFHVEGPVGQFALGRGRPAGVEGVPPG